MVSGAGDDYGRPFLALRLIGERKRYEDNLAKLVNGFGCHLRKSGELQRVVRRVCVVVPDGGEAGCGSLRCGLHQCAVILTAAQKINEVGHFCKTCRRQLQDFLDQQMFSGVHGYLSWRMGAMDYTESGRLYKISGSKKLYGADYSSCFSKSYSKLNPLVLLIQLSQVPMQRSTQVR